jgi:Cft2 family RNA processing exonuclease
MKTRLILELTCFLAASSQVSANEILAQASSNQYTFEDYRKECLQRATSQKLPQDVAQDLCNCTINRFRSQYTIEQFRSLVQRSKTNTEAQETLAATGEACFEEVLYEDE